LASHVCEVTTLHFSVSAWIGDQSVLSLVDNIDIKNAFTFLYYVYKKRIFNVFIFLNVFIFSERFLFSSGDFFILLNLIKSY